MRTSVRDLGGCAYARFRRALDSRNAPVALATATELDFVSLPDALELVLPPIRVTSPLTGSNPGP